MTEPTSPPFISDMVRITSFVEANEILKNADFGSGRFEEESLPFRGRTLLELDGAEHRARRQLETPLIVRTRLDEYVGEVLDPAIRRNLAQAAEDRGEDGIVRTDLAKLSHRMFLEVAAAVIGLDGVDTPERTRALEDCMYKLNAAFDVKFSTRDHDEVIAEGLEAKQEFVADFYGPSVERRAEMLAREQSGELDVGEVPTDLLTIMLRHHGADWDPDLPTREAILYMAGATDTTSNAVNHAVVGMEEWLAEHPEDRANVRDPVFVRGVCNEALRLHQNVTALARRANVDITLSTGREFKAGEEIALDFVQANTDPEAFGQDADVFNPWREVSPATGARPYGLAFGMGRHLCMGLPLITPTSGKPTDDPKEQRALAQILVALIDAGIRLDRERPPQFTPTAEDVYESLPVLLTEL